MESKLFGKEQSSGLSLLIEAYSTAIIDVSKEFKKLACRCHGEAIREKQ